MSRSTDPDHSETDRPDAAAEGGSPTRAATPRWVKIFGIVAVAVLVVLVVVGLFTGGHGPGRHSSTGPAGPAPVTGITALVGSGR